MTQLGWSARALMLRRLGLRAGMSNLLALRSKEGTARLHLGDGRSVAVRRGTADVEAFDEVFLRGAYADDFIQLFGWDRAPGDVRRVLDIGAHIGCAALYFAGRYPNANICALEPDPRNLELLRRNVADDDRIDVVEGALWSTSTTLSLDGDPTRTMGWQARRDEGAGSVRGLTVDELLDQLGWDHVDVMKIDIEGAERQVFGAGDLGWLERVDLILIEVHDWKQRGASRAFHAAVGDGFVEFLLEGVIGAINTAALERGDQPA